MRMLVISSVLAATAASPVLGQTECEYEATRSATLRATSGDVLELIARSGSLTVRGRDGAGEVRVIGHACASSQDLLDELQLETDRTGSTVRVEVADIDDDSWFSSGRRYHRLDLEIEVPRGMAARIEDGSGEIVLEGLGDVDLTDGSGSIEIADIAGDLIIDDGSGSMRVSNVNGSIRVNDGSGSIDISHVDGEVLIDDDGSGGIEVRDVTGDFTVRDDGSGGIRYSNISGTVNIPRRKRGG
jgi:hypothetical protein